MALKEKIRSVSEICKAKITFFLAHENRRQLLLDGFHVRWEEAKTEILDAIHNKSYADFLQGVEQFKSLPHSAAERAWYVENTYMKIAPDFLVHQPDIVNRMQNDPQFFNERAPVAQHCFDQYVAKFVDISIPH